MRIAAGLAGRTRVLERAAARRSGLGVDQRVGADEVRSRDALACLWMRSAAAMMDRMDASAVGLRKAELTRPA